MKEYYENEDRVHKNILNMPDQLLMLDSSELTPLQSNSIMAMLHNSQVDIQVHLKDKPLEYLFDYRFEIKVSDLKMFNDMKKTENLMLDNLHYIKDNVKKLQHQAFQSFDTRSFSSFTIFPEIMMSENEVGEMTLKYQLSTSLLKIIFNRKGYINSVGDYEDDKTLYTPIYLDILMESGLTKKSEICLYKMLLCLGIKFNNHPTLSIYYPIEEFKKIVGVPLYKTGKSLKENIDGLFEKVSPHINFTPKYELKEGKGNKYIGINIKCAYQDFGKDNLYLTYVSKTKEYEDKIDESNKKLLDKLSKEEKVKQSEESKSKKLTTNNINLFIKEKKLPYTLVKREKAINLLCTLLENDQIALEINKVQSYSHYCDKVADYFKTEYYRYKVNEEEFNKGFTFRYFNDWVTNEEVERLL